MRYGRRVVFIFAFLYGLPLAGQDYTPGLARSIASDVGILAGQTTLARWRQNHRAGKVELAHFQRERDAYEVDFTQETRWCAASSDALPPVSRTALFYVPTVRQGALPPLPASVDPSLTAGCQLHAIWYQTRTYSSAEALTRELTLLWGAPNGRRARPDLWDSGRWMRAVSWQRPGVSVWVAEDPDSDQPRLIAFVAKDDAEAADDEQYELLDGALRHKVAEGAAKIAGQDTTLTKWMLGHADCAAEPGPKEPEAVTVDKLSSWLKQAARLSPERRAASLLVADVVVKCTEFSGADTQGLVALGATFPQMCSDGPVYNHNFRDRAARLVPNSRVDELAAVAAFTEPCSLEGRGSWMDDVIATGQKLLAALAPGERTPWLHYAMARAHSARLAYSYPGGFPDPEDSGAVTPPGGRQRARAQAIKYFRLFAAEKPTAREAVWAWYQGWRLLAGLPPPPLHFECGCE